MKKPLTPENEDERQENLDSYYLVDTDAEMDYDRITRLASEICGTPIALISIVDKERQWFKSRVGLDASETPRDVSFCGHAINGNDLFEVKNSLEDERFSDNPLATGEPNVVFYAGQPIQSTEGFNLGTLCVIDNKPKELNENQKRSLKILSEHIRSLLELRKKNHDLTNALNDIEQKSAELINNSKLVSLGRLAGGVAHEINNPLAIIGGRVDQLLMKMKKRETDEKEIKLAHSIKENVKRIKGIVTGMLEFSRDEKVAEVSETSLNECLDMVFQFFKEKCDSIGVKINLDAEDDVRINVNKIQISQIFVNLVNNAIDATEGQKNREVNIQIQREGKKALLKISDNGPGIPEDKIDKVLEPFYSTKETGKGTGLGLSISFGLAGKNGGTLRISREYKGGAEFILELPLIK